LCIFALEKQSKKYATKDKVSVMVTCRFSMVEYFENRDYFKE
jgi:hypothetical protein